MLKAMPYTFGEGSYKEKLGTWSQEVCVRVAICQQIIITLGRSWLTRYSIVDLGR